MASQTQARVLFQPRELMDRIAEQRCEEFVAVYGKAPFLIVRLDAFSNELAMGLAALDTVRDKPQARLQLNQTLQISPALFREITNQTSPSATIPAPDMIRAGGQSAGIPDDLLESACYVLRLRARTPPYSRPLTVGRSSTHDVVLRHASVSAMHARLELGPELLIVDAGSRNGTFVNGRKITEATPLREGDRIKLGAVQAAICSAACLWDAVNRGPAPRSNTLR